MNTTLRLPQIREVLIEELSPILLPFGYKVKNRKGENSFLKQREEGYFEIQFFYDEYFPIDYTVQFVFRCYQNAIQKIIESFFQSTGRDFINVANIALSEGDFIEGQRKRLMKYRAGYKNKLATDDDLGKVAFKYKELIGTEIRPLEDVFCSMGKTAEYVYNNRDLAVGNCSVYMLMTGLISSKLSDGKYYTDLREYFIDELPKFVPVYGVLATRALETVKDLNEYLSR